MDFSYSSHMISVEGLLKLYIERKWHGGGGGLCRSKSFENCSISISKVPQSSDMFDSVHILKHALLRDVPFKIELLPISLIKC